MYIKGERDKEREGKREGVNDMGIIICV